MERDAAQRLEYSQGVASCLISVGTSDFADDYGGLDATKPVLLFDPIVGIPLEGKPLEKPFAEGNSGKAIACGIELPHHDEEGCGLAPYRYYGGEIHGPLSVSR